MKDCRFFWPVSCIGLLAALLTLADCRSSGPLIFVVRNLQSGACRPGRATT